jgi:hypothetical protein
MNYSYDNYLDSLREESIRMPIDYRPCKCGCDHSYPPEDLTWVLDLEEEELYDYYKEKGFKDDDELSKSCIKNEIQKTRKSFFY